MGAWATRAAEGRTDAEGRAEMGGAGAVEVEEAACLTGPVPTPAMCRVALRLDHGARAVAWSNAPLGRKAPQQTAVPVQGAPPTALGGFFWPSVQPPIAYVT